MSNAILFPSEILPNFGNVKFQPFVKLKNETVYPEKIEISKGFSGKNYQIDCFYSKDFADTLYLTVYDREVRVKRIFQNKGPEIKLMELGCLFTEIKLGNDCDKDFFYHNENPRIYERMTFPVDYVRAPEDAKDSEYDETAGNRWADPGVVHPRIGRSPYQPFPAILLGNYETSNGIVHGTLRQKECYHNYLVRHENGSVTLELFSSFKAVDALDFATGRQLNDQWYIGEIDDAKDYDRIFDRYTAHLRKVLPASYGSTDINRTCMTWGSWNDGIFREFTEEMLLNEAKYIKKNFPLVHWLQLDDGYAASAKPVGHVPNTPAHGLGVPYEGENAISKEKFPNGIRHFTDELRKIGLRPAIWIGGFCPHYTPIYKEHPDWFIDYSYRVGTSSPLDVSQEVVRDYIKFALDKLITEYGFEGVKHDFWSYAFEDSHNMYKNKDQSGYFYRDWWLKEIRKRLDDDGYFQTGCDIVMGNPFLGEFFTNYRYGIDIGGGTWDFVKTNFLWGIACFATHTGDLFVPNSDSVGLFPDLNDVDALFALNYCWVTHSMVELAGKLSLEPNHPRLKLLRKALCNVNNGQDVYLANYDFRNDNALIPSTLYFNTPHFSTLENTDGMPKKTVGFFNIFEEDLEVEIKAADIGLDPDKSYIITDVWNEEIYKLAPGASIKTTLVPHGSKVWAVNEDCGIQLLDADAKVDAIAINGNNVSLELPFPEGNYTFTWNQVPSSLIINGKETKFTVNGNKTVIG